MTMANASTQLSVLFDELVQQKTFNLDALDSIKALKVKAESLEAEVTRKDELIKSLNVQIATRDERLAQQGQQLANVSAREKAVTEREAKIHEHEMTAAVSEARARAFEQSMKIVFAPNVVRESLFRGGSVYNASNGQNSSTTDNGNSTRSEGYGNHDEGNTVRSTL